MACDKSQLVRTSESGSPQSSPVQNGSVSDRPSMGGRPLSSGPSLCIVSTFSKPASGLPGPGPSGPLTSDPVATTCPLLEPAAGDLGIGVESGGASGRSTASDEKPSTLAATASHLKWQSSTSEDSEAEAQALRCDLITLAIYLDPSLSMGLSDSGLKSGSAHCLVEPFLLFLVDRFHSVPVQVYISLQALFLKALEARTLHLR
ncbi:unnamed protein product [Protopolystoma xenopodis]|uniref:Uncharacterized protein n=1 Tax=Protopolystoma xenopodis TaxID=117903 RepID=A0A3S5B1D1_9PLAT|nr:unnamed protein product [Protopolystoma xenopodis]